MLTLARSILPLAVLAIACGDGPSSNPVSAPSRRATGQAEYDMSGVSASQSIQAIQDALNAAWAAKDAAGYAAPYAEDGNLIAPVGAVLAGRAAIEARHAILFAGPLKNSTQVITFQRVQMLTGTIAIVDGDAVLTNAGVTTHTLMRFVMTKDQGRWEIAAGQGTPVT